MPDLAASEPARAAPVGSAPDIEYSDVMERSTLISVEEYLGTSYRPDREYVDGALVARNVGEWDHNNLQMVLSAYLFNRR